MKTCNVRVISYLFRFMMIFEINKFTIFKVSDKKIEGQVGWEKDPELIDDGDEEIQDIEWTIQNFENFEDSLQLLEYLYDSKYISNDKIIIDIEEVFSQLDWERKRFDFAVNNMLKMKVDMVDEGKKTDYFFVHF